MANTVETGSETKGKINICTHLQDLLNMEMPALKKEIELNKYYLSEKARHDIGWEAAEKDFIKNYLNIWAAGFKAAYCGYVCPDRNDCHSNRNNQ